MFTNIIQWFQQDRIGMAIESAPAWVPITLYLFGLTFVTRYIFVRSFDAIKRISGNKRRSWFDIVRTSFEIFGVCVMFVLIWLAAPADTRMKIEANVIPESVWMSARCWFVIIGILAATQPIVSVILRTVRRMYLAFMAFLKLVHLMGTFKGAEISARYRMAKDQLATENVPKP